MTEDCAKWLQQNVCAAIFAYAIPSTTSGMSQLRTHASDNISADFHFPA